MKKKEFKEELLTLLEEVGIELERVKVYRELSLFSIKSEKGSKRVSIYYSYLDNEIGYHTAYNDCTKYPGLLFETEECAIKAVESVGKDRVLKYYLEIEE